MHNYRNPLSSVVDQFFEKLKGQLHNMVKIIHSFEEVVVSDDPLLLWIIC